MFGLTAEAQSLADLARRERARRDRASVARQAVAGRIFTNSHLRSAPPSAEPGATTEAEPPDGVDAAVAVEGTEMAPPDQPAVPTPEEVRAAWELAVGEQQAVVQDLEDQEVRQQLEITRIRNVFLAPVSSAPEKNAAEAQMAVVEAQLAQARIELAEARASLEAVQAEEPPAP